jgi:hypothetical protein
MSPKVLETGSLIFWFHSYDAGIISIKRGRSGGLGAG